MDDWYRKLVSALTQETAGGCLPDTEATLEIAFGEARSAFTYALELSRAHRIPVTGNVAGDSIWMQLGDGRIRFTLNRRAGVVSVVQPGHDDTQIAAEQIADADLGRKAREAIDALVASWRALPKAKKRPSAPPPEVDDEPTQAGPSR